MLRFNYQTIPQRQKIQIPAVEYFHCSLTIKEPVVNPSESLAKHVFFWAAIYGFIVLTPQYFLESLVSTRLPPPINHPEHFYGFIGAALAWQFVFLAISKQPSRLRPVMVAAVIEKVSFAGSSFALIAYSRAPLILGVFATIDLILGILFLHSFLKLSTAKSGSGSARTSNGNS